jgi:hypothetical protein
LRGAFFLIFLLTFTQSSFAATGWFARACERLALGKPPVTPPEFLTRVETELRDEVYRQNRINHHGLNLGHAPLEYLELKPVGVEILPQLSPEMLTVRPVDIRLFVNPDSAAQNWKDQATDLGDGPTVVLLFEEVPVRLAAGSPDSTIQDIVERQFAEILDRNPDIKAQMRVSKAAEFPALRFRREYANHKVMWIEGDVPNFKVKRSMLLALGTAFQALASDLRYAQKKPTPPPTRH